MSHADILLIEPASELNPEITQLGLSLTAVTATTLYSYFYHCVSLAQIVTIRIGFQNSVGTLPVLPSPGEPNYIL